MKASDLLTSARKFIVAATGAVRASDLLTSARKFTVAATGAAGEAVAAGLLHGTAERWVTGVLAVLTALLTYAVPNTPNSATTGTATGRRV